MKGLMAGRPSSASTAGQSQQVQQLGQQTGQAIDTAAKRFKTAGEAQLGDIDVAGQTAEFMSGTGTQGAQLGDVYHQTAAGIGSKVGEFDTSQYSPIQQSQIKRVPRYGSAGVKSLDLMTQQNNALGSQVGEQNQAIREKIGATSNLGEQVKKSLADRLAKQQGDIKASLTGEEGKLQQAATTAGTEAVTSATTQQTEAAKQWEDKKIPLNADYDKYMAKLAEINAAIPKAKGIDKKGLVSQAQSLTASIGKIREDIQAIDNAKNADAGRYQTNINSIGTATAGLPQLRGDSKAYDKAQVKIKEIEEKLANPTHYGFSQNSESTRNLSAQLAELKKVPLPPITQYGSGGLWNPRAVSQYGKINELLGYDIGEKAPIETVLPGQVNAVNYGQIAPTYDKTNSDYILGSNVNSVSGSGPAPGPNNQPSNSITPYDEQIVANLDPTLTSQTKQATDFADRVTSDLGMEKPKKKVKNAAKKVKKFLGF